MKEVLILQNKILHYNKPLYNYLAKKYKVTVLHSGNISKFKDDIYNELIVNTTNIGPFIFQHKVISEVRSLKYDVVIAMFDIKWVNNILAMYFKNKQTRFVWWGMGFGKNSIANKIRIYLSKKSNSIVLYTKNAQEVFEKNGLNKNKLFVANNTFHIEKREKAYLNLEKNILLFVGSLDRRKENEKLIIAFSHIVNNINKDIKLVFIGNGQEKINLIELVSSLRLENRVLFKGKITDTDELKNYYKLAIASVSFGQAGLSVLQSLGYGVPFITKKNAVSGGEIFNIVDTHNGILCEDSIISLEDSLKEVCNNIEKSKLMGEKAYIYYNQYCTIQNMVQGFVNAIECKENKNEF